MHKSHTGRALLLATLLFLAGCGQNLTATEHVAKAKDHMDKGELRPAMIELSSAVQKDPNSVEGRWLLAKVAADMGEGARAEKEIQKAMELGLNRASGQLTLVKALLLQGEFDRALQESSVMAPGTSKSDQAAILGLRGQVYVVKGQFDLAQQTLEQALQVKSDSVPALIGMTALHGYQRQYDVSRQWVDKALKADPTSPDAWNALGDLEGAQARLVEAEKAYEQAIKHRAAPYLEQIKRAQVRIQLKKFAEAAADIKSLKDAGFKDHPYVNYVAGLNQFAQGNYEQAAKDFQVSYELDPGFLPNRIYLATAQVRLGNTEQALKYAQKILADAPGSKIANNLLGSVLISRAEYTSAKDILQKTLVNSSNDTEALSLMTNIAMAEGDAVKALEYANRVAELEPDSKLAQDMLLMAKMISGEKLNDQLNAARADATEKGDDYTREFLIAVEAFRNNHPNEALERAKRLHLRYPEKVDPIKLVAASYLRLGKWDNAKSELEKAVKLVPNEPSATRTLAKIETIKGNLKEARDMLGPFVKANPLDEEAVLQLVDIESRIDKTAAIIPPLEQVVQHNPDANRARVKLAAEYLNKGRIQDVLKITSNLTDSQIKGQPALLELRGRAQMLAGDFRAARVTFENWTKLAPKSAPAHYHYANSLAASGDHAGVRKALESALKLNPRYLPARIGEVKMLVHSKELDKAQKALTKLKQDFGDQTEVLGIEGWFALGTKDYARAEKSFSTVIRRNPDTEIAILLVRSMWLQNKNDAAISFMQDWLKSHPKDLSILLHLAGAYLGMNRNDEARATYSKVVEISPEHVPALNNLAWLSRDKDLKRAMEYAQRAYQLAPKDPYVLDTLGMLTLKNGDLSRATSLLRDANARSPNDAQIQVHLATVLIQQGQRGEARKMLENVKAKATNKTAAEEARKLLEGLGER